jgi:hypothetical protein
LLCPLIQLKIMLRFASLRDAYSAPEVKGVFDPSKSNFDYRVNSMVSKS